jgi:hypothetical protein
VIPRQLLSMVAATFAVAACDGSEASPPHPADALNFPLSVTADPSGRIAWVVSGNFDLRWRGGAVLAVDVVENRFVPELAFEVGSFPGPFVVKADETGAAMAGYVASRADDALYHVALSSEEGVPTGIACEGATAASGILRCPRSGAVTSGRSPAGESLRVGDDPFELALIESRAEGVPDLLVSAAMRDGVVATYALAEDGVPTLAGNLQLNRTVFGLAADPVSARVFATHKGVNALNVLGIRDRNAGDAEDDTNPWLSPLQTLTINEFISQTAGRDRARSAILSADGSRLYVSFRGPDSIVVFDARPDDAATQLREIRKIPLSGDPGELALLPAADGRPELVFVSCFDANRVDVVDPAAGHVVAGIRTGQGPSGLAIVNRPDLGIQRLFVALFNAHAVGVIELDPSSPDYLTTLAEIR